VPDFPGTFSCDGPELNRGAAFEGMTPVPVVLGARQNPAMSRTAICATGQEHARA
jgi:hypothetical protein